ILFPVRFYGCNCLCLQLRAAPCNRRDFACGGTRSLVAQKHNSSKSKSKPGAGTVAIHNFTDEAYRRSTRLCFHESLIPALEGCQVRSLTHNSVQSVGKGYREFGCKQIHVEL